MKWTRFWPPLLTALLLAAGAAGAARMLEPAASPPGATAERLSRNDVIGGVALPEAGAVLRATTVPQLPAEKDARTGANLPGYRAMPPSATPLRVDGAARSRAVVATLEYLSYGPDQAAARSGRLPFRGISPPPTLHG